MLFTSLGRSVLGKTVPAASGGIQDLGHSFSQYGPTGWGLTYIYFKTEFCFSVKKFVSTRVVHKSFSRLKRIRFCLKVLKVAFFIRITLESF